MAEKKSNSRALRNFAEGLFDGLAADGRIPHAEKDDFVTSMVRQWITYDGNATWFFDEEQVYFVHRHTPLGKPILETKPRPPGWFAEMRLDWKIDPESFPGIIEQLNRGQSAQVTNTEGVPLRLWVNPKERSRGVESLAAQPIRQQEYIWKNVNEVYYCSWHGQGDTLGLNQAKTVWVFLGNNTKT